MKPRVESIFCHDCDEIRPVVHDFMPGGSLNDHDSTDLVCDRYHHHPTHTANPEIDAILKKAE